MTDHRPAGPAPLRTSLQRHAVSGYSAEQLRDRARRHAVRAWCEQGILVIALEDGRLTWPERELLRQLGERLAGAPAGGGR